MDYLSYFTRIPGFNWVNMLTIFLLSLFRLAPIVVMPPFFGGKLLPGSTKIGFVLILSMIFLPLIVHNTTVKLEVSMFFTALALKELLVGFFLAFFVSIPFFVVQSSGVIIDYMRGASIFQQQDPLLQNQASPFGMLFNFILIYMFYQIDGPFLFLSAVEKSYRVLPADVFLPSLFFDLKSPIWAQCVGLLNTVAALSIQLAAPGMLSILMTEVFLGVANRLAPQVQIAFLGMSLKSFVGVGVLWIGLFYIFRQFAKQTLDWLQLIDKLIDTLIPLRNLG